MNEQQLDNIVRPDAVKGKKDFSTLVGDTVAQFEVFEDNVSQATGKAKEDLTTWVDDNVSQLSKGFNKLASDTRETVVETEAKVTEDVGHGLRQYNAKAQEVADKIPGGVGEKAARYPWVAISIALVVGLLLGFLLKPTRKLLG